MKITKEQFKNIVREVMTEESEYQTFFKKSLEKTGKSIPDMSDEEKKAFFNKIDSAWDAKGEKNEATSTGGVAGKGGTSGGSGDAFTANDDERKEKNKRLAKDAGSTIVKEKLVGGQKKLDVDGDGEIEASDLAALRAGKKADESVNEVKFYAFFNNKKHEIEGKDLLDAKQKAITMLKVPKSKVGLLAIVNANAHDKGSFRYESVNEGIGTIALGVAGGLLLLKVLKFVVKKVLGAIGMNAPLPKEKLHKTTDELFKQVLVTGGKLNMRNFMALRSVIKEMIDKGQITTLSQIIKVIEKASKEEPKNESVNEALLPADTKVVKSFFDKKPLEGRNLNTDGKVLKTAGIGSQEMYTHTPKGVKMVGKVTGKYAQSLVQFVNKNYKSDLVESIVNEEIKVGQMVKVVDNPHWEASLGKKGPFKRKVKGIYGDSVFFTDGSNSSMKYVKESVESVNEAVSKTYKIPTQRGTLHIEVEEDPAGVFVDVIFNRVELTTTDIQFPTGEIKITQRQKRVKLKESVNEGKKVFKVNPGIGKAKYSISSHDGKKTHKDGSDFYDIEIFNNKVDLEKGIKKYTSNGFVKESVNEGLWPKSKLPQSFQFALAPELKKNFKGIFYSIGDDIYHNDKKVLSVDGDRDSVNSIIAKLKKIVK